MGTSTSIHVLREVFLTPNLKRLTLYHFMIKPPGLRKPKSLILYRYFQFVSESLRFPATREPSRVPQNASDVCNLRFPASLALTGAHANLQNHRFSPSGAPKPPGAQVANRVIECRFRESLCLSSFVSNYSYRFCSPDAYH